MHRHHTKPAQESSPDGPADPAKQPPSQGRGSLTSSRELQSPSLPSTVSPLRECVPFAEHARVSESIELVPPIGCALGIGLSPGVYVCFPKRFSHGRFAGVCCI